jgi:predicted extracellular nuclease
VIPFNTSDTSFTVTGLNSETNYCFTVYAKDAAGNISDVSNQDCETTLSSGSGSNELFISEYVEGSSNNKVIEIANFTGALVSLSNYTLARNTNSGTSWGVALQLTGNIPDHDVFVISRGDASAAAQAQADQLSSADAMSFNGDDPVGLFKNGTLIDIFGNFNGSNPYSNKTFRRKSSVAGPTTNFNLTNEWDEYPQDTFDGLGSHSQTLSIDSNSVNKTHFYPNPLTGNSLKVKTSKSLKVEIFNVLGKRVLFDNVNSDKRNVDVSSLKRGIYIIKLSNQNEAVTKKLIRQ